MSRSDDGINYDIINRLTLLGLALELEKLQVCFQLEKNQVQMVSRSMQDLRFSQHCL
jgi:hypothetical protein